MIRWLADLEFIGLLYHILMGIRMSFVPLWCYICEIVVWKHAILNSGVPWVRVVCVDARDSGREWTVGPTTWPNYNSIPAVYNTARIVFNTYALQGSKGRSLGWLCGEEPKPGNQGAKKKDNYMSVAVIHPSGNLYPRTTGKGW